MIARSAVALVLALMATSANAVNILQLDFYETTCSGEKTSIPFMVANNNCLKVSDQTSFIASCGGITVFSESAECKGQSQFVGLTCQNLADAAQGGGGGVSITGAIGFSCKDYPIENVVQYISGTSCTDGKVSGVTQNVIQIINTCMLFPVFGGAATSAYKSELVDASTLTYSFYFNDKTCASEPLYTFNATVGGECVEATPTIGRLLGDGRALQTTAVQFQPVTDGNSASTAFLSVAVLVAAMASLVLVA